MSFLPLILDIAIIILLGATILFAARLSIHIQAFRSNRAELETLIRNLSEQIGQADRAVAGMRESARESGRDLQERINVARALAEELQFMNETGNNLAARLEKAATSQPKSVTSSDKGASVGAYEEEVFAPSLKPSTSPRSQSDNKPSTAKTGAQNSKNGAGFAIRDPEFNSDMDDEGFAFEDDDDLDGFESRAERELFKALQSGRPKGV
jgi:hypothetical protein